jgi:hypothetical protein
VGGGSVAAGKDAGGFTTQDLFLWAQYKKDENSPGLGCTIFDEFAITRKY